MSHPTLIERFLNENTGPRISPEEKTEILKKVRHLAKKPENQGRVPINSIKKLLGEKSTAIFISLVKDDPNYANFDPNERVIRC